jgi:hypothetical protein
LVVILYHSNKQIDNKTLKTNNMETKLKTIEIFKNYGVAIKVVSDKIQAIVICFSELDEYEKNGWSAYGKFTKEEAEQIVLDLTTVKQITK